MNTWLVGVGEFYGIVRNVEQGVPLAAYSGSSSNGQCQATSSFQFERDVAFTNSYSARLVGAARGADGADRGGAACMAAALRCHRRRRQHNAAHPGRPLTLLALPASLNRSLTETVGMENSLEVSVGLEGLFSVKDTAKFSLSTASTTTQSQVSPALACPALPACSSACALARSMQALHAVLPLGRPLKESCMAAHWVQETTTSDHISHHFTVCPRTVVGEGARGP